MINKKYLSGILGVIVASTIFITSALNTSAEVSKETVVLTRTQALDMALGNNNNILRLDAGINTMLRNFKKYKKLSDEITKLLDGFEDYKDEYEEISSEEFKAKQREISDKLEKYNELSKRLEDLKKELEEVKNGSSESSGTRTEEEIKDDIDKVNKELQSLDKESLDKESDEIKKKLAKFEQQKALYVSMGLASPADGTPIKLTQEQEYNRFVKARDIIWHNLQTNLEKMKYQKEAVSESIKYGVETAYDNILFAQEGLKIQKQLYEKQQKDYNNILAQYENGRVSENDKNIAEKELEKLKLQVENLTRQIENGKIQLKQLLGIDLEKTVELTESIDTNINEPKDYDEYLSSALLNRNEIIAAKLDCEEAERTFDIIKDYLDDDDYDWMDAERTLNEAQTALLEAEKEVRQNIKNAYLDVTQKKAEIDLAHKKLEAAQVQYNAVKKNYEAGRVALPMLWNVEIGVNSAKMNYDNAVIKYKTALKKLEAASKIGPGY